jgi:hypothetical protein
MFVINEKKINKFLLFGFVITFFSKDFWFNFYANNIYIDFFSYIFFILIFSLYVNFNIQEWKKIYFYFLIFLGIQIIIKIFNNFSIFPLLKQLIPIIIIYISTYYIIKKNGLKTIFDYYLKILLIVCIFGLIQIILDNFFSVNLFQKVPKRIDSIFREPSHFALLILPGLTYGILNLKKYKFSTLVFFINLIFTFSFAGYLSFAITLFVIFIIKKNKSKNLIYSFFLIVIPILTFIVFENNTYNYFKKNNVGFLSSILKNDLHFKILLSNDRYNNEIKDLGLYSVTSNLIPAINMLTINPLGSGMGGHEEAYYNYVQQYQLYGSFNDYQANKLKRYGYNSKSAHSLSIRLLSEFGIVFLITILIILKIFFSNFNKFSNDQINIIIACLSYIIFRCIKLGGYFDYGIYFFIVAILTLIFERDEPGKFNI